MSLQTRLSSLGKEPDCSLTGTVLIPSKIKRQSKQKVVLKIIQPLHVFKTF